MAGFVAWARPGRFRYTSLHRVFQPFGGRPNDILNQRRMDVAVERFCRKPMRGSIKQMAKRRGGSTIHYSRTVRDTYRTMRGELFEVPVEASEIPV